jgi:hypothetical protein
MQKPNFDNVKQFFESNGWDIEVEYSECIKLHAEKFETSPEDIDVYFAYVGNNFAGADLEEYEIEDAKKYTELNGDNVYYSGTPEAVELYEREFGVNSMAARQIVTPENKANVEAKPVAAVEEAFKRAGYRVELSVGLHDKATAIETWQVNCMSTSPMNTLVAGFGYSKDWAKDVSEGQLAVAEMSNQTLKIDGCWWYYGTADAVALFESFGTINPAALFTAMEVKLDESIGKVEAAFKGAGYNVTVTPMPDGSMLSCIKPGSADTLTAGNGNAEFVGLYGGAMKGTADSLGVEMKYNGNWYYFGGPESVKIIESVL